MGYDNDPYRDEDGEPLMDFDHIQSDGEPEQHQHDLLDDEDVGDWRQRDRSPTPVHDFDDSSSKSKPRKRLIKKSVGSSNQDSSSVPNDFIDDFDDQPSFAHDEYDPSSSSLLSKRKFSMKESDGGSRKKKDKKGKSERRHEGKGSSSSKFGMSSRGKDHEGDPEMKEMWDTIAGGDSEDDQAGVRTVDDDNFIDDSGVDPADGYGSDNERFLADAPQAEEEDEDEEINRLFKMGKKKKKNEKSAAEIALVVEQFMAELEVTAEEDAELNRQGKPAINKLKKLPLLTELQQEFLDHGVLTLLKNWLEPLPDGSLPNINIRAAILKILTDFPIDLEQYDRREQLKKSGLGKVIMFLSRSDEETTANRKLAKDLVDQWSRPIFNKSTRFEDMRHAEVDRVPFRRPPSKKQTNKASGLDNRDDDLDLGEFPQGKKSSQSSSRLHASRPEAMPLDFVVRPQSKIDPDEIRARAKQTIQNQRRLKMNKKLQQLKAPKKKQLQATKLSVEGRGMVKYL
ncbi:Transcription factor IIS, N-terminal [Dillenia turbinata]|uniref:Transcription factor IIS, N-terminal n=1 Tax=Dillenia turbinata TaxID=194707 RepID=A0AAN8WEP2_9MAGN